MEQDRLGQRKKVNEKVVRAKRPQTSMKAPVSKIRPTATTVSERTYKTRPIARPVGQSHARRSDMGLREEQVHRRRPVNYNADERAAKKEELFEEQPPFYKRWYVWVGVSGVLLVIIIIMAVAKGGESKITTTTVESALSSKSNDSETAKTEETQQTTEAGTAKTKAELEAAAKKKAEEEAQAKQEAAAAEEAAAKKKAEEEAQKAELQDTTTVKEKEALAAAKAYLSAKTFSKNGLISQLKSDGYSASEAEYGASESGANWNAQALKKAKEYISANSKITEDSLEVKLKSDGFTEAQVIYAIDNCGLDLDDAEDEDDD